jgi:aspartate racemase
MTIDCRTAILDERSEINRIIFEELVRAVVLGCTELPLAIDESNSALPTLDSTRLLALAALQRAIGKTIPVS